MTNLENNITTIDGLVDVIKVHNPEVLKTLGEDYPQFQNQISGGKTLGQNNLALEATIKVALEGLRIAQQRFEPNLRKLKTRLETAKKLRLVGSIVAALTSAGVITAILAKWDAVITITTALINLIATFCALFASHLESPSYGGSGNLVEHFEMLINNNVEAEQLIQKLEISTPNDSNTQEITALINQANGIAFKLRLAELRLGGESS